LIARPSTRSIGEAAAGFLDEENPRRVILLVVALARKASISPRTCSTSGSGLAGGRPAPGGRRALESSSRAASAASASVEVVLTCRRRVLFSSRGQDDSKAPPPRVAHQQRRSAGEVTTATSIVP
jgi:hypothetical protein